MIKKIKTILKQSLPKTLKKLAKSNFSQTQKFSSLPGILESTVETLKSQNFITTLPIQSATYSELFSGKNLLARDKTGSGKTLAFSLPLIENLRQNKKFEKTEKNQKSVYMLIMTPTRELAIQITNVIEGLKNEKNEFNVVSLYGGTNVGDNIRDLKNYPGIVVGTPGRISDMIERGFFKLGEIEKIVLDETDRMLDMGFLRNMEDIFKKISIARADLLLYNETLQYACFSATIPKWVDEISKKLMKKDLVKIDLLKNSTQRIPKEVKHYYYKFQTQEQKLENVSKLVYSLTKKNSQVLIFTNTKQEADEIKNQKEMRQFSNCFHGGIDQDRREMILKGYRIGYFKVLICTDVAGRGLDIPETDLIVNLSPPTDMEDFIHRCGRTGRAGRAGSTLTLLTDREMRVYNDYVKRCGIETSRLENEDVYFDTLEKSVGAFRRNFKDVEEELAKEKMKSFYLDNLKVQLLEKYDSEDLIERFIYNSLDKKFRGSLQKVLKDLKEFEYEKKSDEDLDKVKSEGHFKSYLESDETLFIEVPEKYQDDTLILLNRGNKDVNRRDIEETLRNFGVPFKNVGNAGVHFFISFNDKFECQKNYFKLANFNVKGLYFNINYSRARQYKQRDNRRY